METKQDLYERSYNSSSKMKKLQAYKQSVQQFNDPVVTADYDRIKYPGFEDAIYS